MEKKQEEIYFYKCEKCGYEFAMSKKVKRLFGKCRNCREISTFNRNDDW